MNYDIDFINDVAPTVIDSEDQQREFEREYAQTNGVDIGGLMVYTLGGKVTGVYDYENYVGWVVA